MTTLIQLLVLSALSMILTGQTVDARPLPAATVHGTITVPEGGARRVASRYAGSTAPQSVQPLNAIVFLRGTATSAPAARQVTMEQRDTAFTPNLYILPVGSTVDFQNGDPFFHNVFSYSKTKRFDLGRFPRPEKKVVEFDETGIVNVFCEIHKSMRAVIVVVDNSYHTEVAADGTYRIENVPAGNYELVIWHADHGTKTQKVQVPASGSVRVDAKL
ncbi:MAG: carboxypeptidase regulatory-like domain-containing protein [Gemmatimonadota bacterium]